MRNAGGNLKSAASHRPVPVSVLPPFLIRLALLASFSPGEALGMACGRFVNRPYGLSFPAEHRQMRSWGFCLPYEGSQILRHGVVAQGIVVCLPGAGIEIRRSAALCGTLPTG